MSGNHVQSPDNHACRRCSPAPRRGAAAQGSAPFVTAAIPLLVSSPAGQVFAVPHRWLRIRSLRDADFRNGRWLDGIQLVLSPLRPERVTVVLVLCGPFCRRTAHPQIAVSTVVGKSGWAAGCCPGCWSSEVLAGGHLDVLRSCRTMSALKLGANRVYTDPRRARCRCACSRGRPCCRDRDLPLITLAAGTFDLALDLRRRSAPMGWRRPRRN